MTRITRNSDPSPCSAHPRKEALWRTVTGVALLVAISLGYAPGVLAQSTDATLSGLALSSGGNNVPLDDDFDADDHSYRAAVANTVSTLTVTPEKGNEDAAVEYLDGKGHVITDTNTSTPALDMSLSTGRNVIKVKVTAEDESSSETYTVTVARAAGAPSTCDAVWCAKLTTGASRTGGATLYGYRANATGVLRGALAPASFEIEGTTYTVEQIGYARGGVVDHRYQFFLDKVLPVGAYTLYIDDAPFSVTGGGQISRYGSSVGEALRSTMAQRFGEVVEVRLVELQRDLVSNKTEEFDLGFANYRLAQGFQVGLHHNDYILTHVDIRFHDSNTATDVDVEIWSRGDSTNEPRERMEWFGPPGSRLVQLTNPRDVSGGGFKRFTAPDDTRLGFGAYFVVITRVGDTNPALSTTASVAQTHASGTHGPKPSDYESHWLIGDGIYRQTRANSSWTADHAATLGITVRGNARPWSTNNKLSGIRVWDNNGGTRFEFAEDFDPDKSVNLTLRKPSDQERRKHAQVIRVPETTESITLRPTPEDADVPWIAFIDENDRRVGVWRDRTYHPASEGPPQYRLELKPGRNTFTIEVLAQAKTLLFDDASPPNERGWADSYRYYFLHIDRGKELAPCGPDDVWCGIMTVGNDSQPSGYSSGSFGEMSPDTFSFGGKSFTVNRVRLRHFRSLTNMELRLTPLSTATAVFDDAEYTLIVDGRRFALNGRYFPGGRFFEWQDPNINWYAGEEVRVRLVRSGGVEDGCPTGDIWCAIMTVGDYSSHRGFRAGIESYGALSDTTFDYNGTTYTVNKLYYDTYSETAAYVFNTQPGEEVFDQPGFALALDGTTLSLNGNHASTGGVAEFQIDAPNPNWSNNDDVFVRLTGPAGTGTDAPQTPGALLTASLDDRPGAHNGASPFKVRVAFSEDIATSYRHLGAGFTVTGGSITSVRRVNKQSDLWELAVEPSGDADAVFTLEGGRACTVTGAPCTSDGRTLSETLTFTVPGPDTSPRPVQPLDARIDHAPPEHDGSSRFEVRIEFTLPIVNSFRDVPDAATMSGGSVKSAKRHEGRSDVWNLRVVPDGNGPVTLTLPANGTCGDDHPAVLCTADGLTLMHEVSVTVPGPEAISVADAEANESDGQIDFTVSLDRPAIGTVTVDYATRDGTATAGEDYTQTSGTLTFNEDEETKTVSVALLDDAVDEGEETFTLVLSNPVGARIADGEATGTIENDDPLQKAWLARFGRTVASQVTNAVSDRLGGPLEGAQVTVGGQSVDLARTDDEAWLGQAMTSVARALGAPHGPAPEGGDWPGTGFGAAASPAPGGAAMREISGRELLLGSAFHLARDGEGDGPSLAAWGRVTAGGFDGEAPAGGGAVRIDGEVTTGILGADAEWNRLLAGAAISVSEGEGRFDQPGVDSGTIESTMTTVSPYARVSLNNRVSVWGLAGWGTGDLTIVQAANDRGQPERTARTDLEMRLAALGGRGALMRAEETGGMDLALKADALWVETKSKAVSNEGDIAATASRVRLALEGSRAFRMEGGGTLTPGLELGLRHDNGDAETGTGVELGGSLSWSDPETGLSVEARGRGLVAHEDSNYREWGASGAVRLSRGERGRGLSFSLAPTWGAASSGVERLWGAQDARGLAPDGTFEAEPRLEGELGYGLGLFGDRFTGTPSVGFGLSDNARDYRIGWRLNSVIPGDPGFEVNLDATRRKAANSNEPPEHGVMLRSAIRW